MIIMPVLAGYIFDRTDSYTIVIWIFIGMYVIGTLIFALIQKPKPPIRLSPSLIN
jgi:cyanate permease